MWIVGGDHHGWIPPRDAPGDVSASPARLAACSCGPTTTAGRPRDTGGRHARPAHEDRHCSGRPAHHQVQDRPGHQPDHRLHLPRTRRWGGIPGDGSTLLLVCMLPTSAYHAGYQPLCHRLRRDGPALDRKPDPGSADRRRHVQPELRALHHRPGAFETISPIDRSILGEAVREIALAQRRLANVAAYSETDDWLPGGR